LVGFAEHPLEYGHTRGHTGNERASEVAHVRKHF
jgi:hypothetical protein